MHGPEDCSVGRIQLCAINYLEGDPDAIMEFVTCQMHFDNDQTGETVHKPLYENNREMLTTNFFLHSVPTNSTFRSVPLPIVTTPD